MGCQIINKKCHEIFDSKLWWKAKAKAKSKREAKQEVKVCLAFFFPFWRPHWTVFFRLLQRHFEWNILVRAQRDQQIRWLSLTTRCHLALRRRPRGPPSVLFMPRLMPSITYMSPLDIIRRMCCITTTTIKTDRIDTSNRNSSSSKTAETIYRLSSSNSKTRIARDTHSRRRGRERTARAVTRSSRRRASTTTRPTPASITTGRASRRILIRPSSSQSHHNHKPPKHPTHAPLHHSKRIATQIAISISTRRPVIRRGRQASSPFRLGKAREPRTVSQRSA